MRQDWGLGSEPFRAEMLQYIERQKGQWHYGVELRQSAEAKAERLIAEALRTRGVTGLSGIMLVIPFGRGLWHIRTA